MVTIKRTKKSFIAYKRLLYSVMLMAFMGSVLTDAMAMDQTNVIKQKLQRLIVRDHIPGAVLSYKVGDSKLTTLAVGYSVIKPKQKMKTDSLFLVGSISKSFTSAIILRLIEQGKFSLNETLGSIAKDYNGHIRNLVSKYPSLAPMSVKELLDHTSGVPQSINTKTLKTLFAQNPHTYFSSLQLMQIAMQHKVYFSPGKKGLWSYTNTDYILLGLIIEDVTGKSFATNFNMLLKIIGIEKLYLANKGLISPDIIKEVVSGYMLTNTPGLMAKAFHENPVVNVAGKKMFQINAGMFNVFSPAASGVIASAPAIVRWYDVLFYGNLLTKKTLKDLITPVPNGKYNQAGYALGVSVHRYPGLGQVISHDGLEPGYSGVVMNFPKEKLILAIMTNASTDKVSTFNVHNGAIIPGLVTHLLPMILKRHPHA